MISEHINMLQYELIILRGTNNNASNQDRRNMYIGTIKTYKEKYRVVVYLMVSNHWRYGEMLEYLDNNYTYGINEWPNILTSVHHLLKKVENYRRYMNHFLQSGIIYAMYGDIDHCGYRIRPGVRGSDGRGFGYQGEQVQRGQVQGNRTVAC